MVILEENLAIMAPEKERVHMMDTLEVAMEVDIPMMVATEVVMAEEVMVNITTREAPH